MKRIESHLQDRIIRGMKGIMPRRRVIGVRILRATKHKPGHPQFHEFYDPATGRMKREGCCDHVPAIVFVGELPKMYAGRVDVDQVNARRVA